MVDKLKINRYLHNLPILIEHWRGWKFYPVWNYFNNIQGKIGLCINW